MRKFTLLIAIAFVLGFSAQSQFEWMNVHNTTDGASLTAVDFLDEDNGVAVGANGTILKTTDGGETWETLSSPFDDDLEGVACLEDDVIVAVGHSGRIMRSMDGGMMWANIEHPAGSVILYDVDIDPASGQGLIAGMGNLIMWTEDAGATWEYVDGGLMNSYYGAFMNDDDFGIVAGKNAIMQPLLGYTDDGGESWDYRDVYPVFGTTAYEGTAYDAYFFNSEDGFVAGTTWDGIGFITIEVDWSSNGWEAIQFSQPIETIDFANDNYGVVAGHQGYISETNNGGATWEDAKMVSGRATGNFREIIAFETTGYGVTNNGEIFKRVNTTSLNDHPGTVKDLHIVPNPVKEGTTTLHIAMREQNDVTVSLVDMTGQKVKELFKTNLPKGDQQITLNTSGLNTGVYMVVVNTGIERYTEKVVIR